MLSCRDKLYKYGILNYTNFYPFYMKKKVGLLGLGLGLEL